ncbi:ATP-binding protein [Aliikangiella coralliicola]|uniref:histidine kinase n=1 Tax=Aliikangiella coralliicola TaxID=2592383 RepID=A0A545UF00_9GAMM|nr:ATP-binding protein [Aliikangiella coralliicola]TQV88062.1 hypothetical protein FLL46_09650 [Aliikangiella coralliicola]
MLNLLSNAVKFTSSGHVSFSVRLKSIKSDICRLKFEIEDTGIGIEKSQLQSIFIPFQQLDNAITRAEGTCLGLTISQRLVKLMGSKLQLKSEPKKGSKFWFELNIPVIGKENINSDDVSISATTAQQNEPIILPQKHQLDALIEQTKRHNILGIRSILKELELQRELAPFLNKTRPYVEKYRFKELAEWLEKHETS